jgi:hypothetical protein
MLLPSLMWKMQAGYAYRIMIPDYESIQHIVPEDWSSVDGLAVGIMYHTNLKKLNPVALVRKRTVLTEQLPHVCKVSANYCG